MPHTLNPNQVKDWLSILPKNPDIVVVCIGAGGILLSRAEWQNLVKSNKETATSERKVGVKEANRNRKAVEKDFPRR